MTPISPNTVIDALQWRYATKKFDGARKIPEETWAALERALVLAPSSFGLQPWKFVVVQDPSTREKLSGASWGQRQPVDCSHFVVFAARKGYDAGDLGRFIERTAQVRGATRESLKGYEAIISGSAAKARSAGTLDAWMARQVYIALGQFMASAALLGVDTCPMEGLDPAQYDSILGLSGIGYGTLCAAAAGYRAAADTYAGLPKVRFRDEDVIVHV